MVNMLEYTWCVVVDYDYAVHKRGKIISYHKTYEDACKHAKGNSFVSVKHVTDLKIYQ